MFPWKFDIFLVCLRARRSPEMKKTWRQSHFVAWQWSYLFLINIKFNSFFFCLRENFVSLVSIAFMDCRGARFLMFDNLFLLFRRRLWENVKREIAASAARHSPLLRCRHVWKVHSIHFRNERSDCWLAFYFAFFLASLGTIISLKEKGTRNSYNFFSIPTRLQLKFIAILWKTFSTLFSAVMQFLLFFFFGATSISIYVSSGFSFHIS